jgi:hypothetical protein
MTATMRSRIASQIRRLGLLGAATVVAALLALGTGLPAVQAGGASDAGTNIAPDPVCNIKGPNLNGPADWCSDLT